MDLIGKNVTISIGEPWDFCSSAGENKLKGIIKSIVMSDCVVLDVSPFKNKEMTINKVIGVNRYVSNQNVISELEQGKEVTLNFMFALDGSNIDSDISFLKKEFDESKHSFLVGSLKVC